MYSRVMRFYLIASRSAGPGSKCIRIVLVFFWQSGGSHAAQKNIVLDVLFQILDHFGRSLLTLGPLLGSLLQPRGHFWITLVALFEQKNRLGRKRYHRRRQRQIAYQKLTLLDTMLESFSEEFYIFQKKHVFLFRVFCMLGLFVFLVPFTASGRLKI